MRASLFLAGLAAASLLGAGAVAVGCSSSSSGSPPAGDDASTATDAPATTPDTGTEDAPATPCTPVSDASAATIVTGSPSWDCYESKCTTSLTACGADCECNNAILTALNCIAMDAGTTTACFGPVSSSAEPATTAVLTCLLANSTCMSATGDGGTGDGGTAEAGPTEAGADAGDGG
jgi:hypothetical protein